MAVLLLAFLVDNSAVAQTQYDLDMQAQAQYTAADEQLNVVYKRILKRDTPSRARRLRKSERTWIAYRDREATAECAESVGGSIYPMEYSEALCQLTEKRIQWLDAYARGRQ